MKSSKVLRCAVAVLAILIVLPFLGDLQHPFWRSRVRNYSIEVLEDSKTESDLRAAVGTLGILLVLPDDSWIAIRYNDTHSGNIFSYAVARDSGGRWFESDRHFCGSFMGYRNTLKREAELRSLVPESEREGDIDFTSSFESVHRVANSPDLQTARENLLQLGFSPMSR